jgi:hypothetical protein
MTKDDKDKKENAKYGDFSIYEKPKHKDPSENELPSDNDAEEIILKEAKAIFSDMKKQENKVVLRLENILKEFSSATSDKFVKLSKQLRQDVADKFSESMLDEIKNNVNILESQIGELKESIDLATKKVSRLRIDSLKTVIMRWLGIILISSLCASISSYFIMKKFPQRVSLSNNKEVNISNSEVSIWGRDRKSVV